MKNYKNRFLLFSFILLFNGSSWAITFAERYHCDSLFHVGTGPQLQKWHDVILKDVMKLEKNNGDRKSIAHYYALLCECTLSLGHYSQSLIYAKKAKDIYDQLARVPESNPLTSLSPDHALVTHYMGCLNFYLMNNYQNSLDCNVECGRIIGEWCERMTNNKDKSILSQQKNNLLYVSVIMGIGEIMIDLSGHNYANAAKVGPELINNIKELYPDKAFQRFEYIDALFLLSNVCIKAQDYEQALQYSQEALSSIEASWGTNNTAYAQALYTNATIFFHLNDMRKCENCLFKSIEIYEKTGHTTHAEYACSLELLGHLYKNFLITQEARKYYEKARQIIKQSCGENSFPVFLNHYYSATLLMQEGKYKEAFIQLGEIIENKIFSTNMNGDHVISAITCYYEAALKSGNCLQIMDKVADSEEILDMLGNVGQSEANRLFIAIGKIYQTVHRQTDACSAYQKALSYFKDMARRNFSFLSEEQRSIFWDRDKLRYETILLQNQYTQDDYYGSIGKLLYNAALLQKGLLLNTSVNMARIIEEKGSESLKRDMHRLQLMSQSKLKNNEDQQEFRQLEQYVQQEARKYGDFMNFTEYTWQDVLKVMNPKDIAIEFVSSEDDEHVYASAEILRYNQKIPLHIHLFSCHKDDQLNDTQISAKYVQAIRQKLLPLLKPGDNVFFAPVGRLYQLPIEYLELEGGKRMDEVYHMYRVSSTRELITMKSRKQPQKNIALFGGLNYNSSVDDMEMQAMITKEQSETTSRGSNSQQWQYLSHSMDEVQTISNIMSDAKYKISLFTQDEGVEEQFKSLSETHTGIIHIATHGFYEMSNGNDMEHAGLILTGANNFWNSRSETKLDIDDGILTAAEISNLNLIGTDLVVLSACQTGLGKVTGEGVFGLQRAFKKAGVQSILMSLWKVDDEATKVLMTAFYQYLKAGDTKREALRKAQALVRQKKFSYNGQLVSGSDIHFWGAFVLID